ncbi:MAG: SDR family oxidoreductase [Nitrospirae bacterium]|nr:SDR family oxidoreductase [Nitrospirota bacterium]
MKNVRVLVLGITGMLGHTLFKKFFSRENWEVYGTARGLHGLDEFFVKAERENIIGGVDVENIDAMVRAIGTIRPDVLINCVGIIKQLPIAKDPLTSITINSLFPHRLAHICNAAGARMIHISTDCVFSGRKGNYTEDDISDAEDLYGRTKYLGEAAYPHCVTLRTSIIGHELKGGHGLIDWFLAQKEKTRGYTRAIYTGFPTVEIARIIEDYVIPNKELKGLYQVSSDPISKYDLLRLVAERYGKNIDIEPYNDFFCDRSLNSKLFRSVSGYAPPSWPELVERMHRHFKDKSK